MNQKHGTYCNGDVPYHMMFVHSLGYPYGAGELHKVHKEAFEPIATMIATDMDPQCNHANQAG